MKNKGKYKIPKRTSLFCVSHLAMLPDVIAQYILIE
jgi:hypothetical protein